MVAERVKDYFAQQLLVPAQNVELLASFGRCQQELVRLEPLKNVDKRSLFSEGLRWDYRLEIYAFEAAEVRQDADKLEVVAPAHLVFWLPFVKVSQLGVFFVDYSLRGHRFG
jgi:hypothetical protein